jgi:hypothetical protein
MRVLRPSLILVVIAASLTTFAHSDTTQAADDLQADKPDENAPIVERDFAREAAEWVIANRGTVKCNFGGGIGPPLGDVTKLPPGKLRVDEIDLRKAGELTDRDLERIGRVSDLRHLLLTDQSISDAGLAHLAGLTGLHSLALERTKVGDAGLRIVAGMPKLRSLKLNGTRITDDTLAAVAQCTDLTQLWLEGTRITDAGLLRLQPLVKLEVLSLNGTGIGDQGLAVVEHFPALRWLFLNYCYVTDAAVPHVTSSPKLTHLYMHLTCLTEAGRDAVLAALPKCTVAWDKYSVRAPTPAVAAPASVRVAGYRNPKPAPIASVLSGPVPKYLTGSVIYMSPAPTGPETEPGLGLVDLSFAEDTSIFLAASWMTEVVQEKVPNTSWRNDRTTRIALVRDGWLRVGELEFAEKLRFTNHDVYWKRIKKGETLSLRTRRLRPPLVIVPAASDANPVDLVPDDSAAVEDAEAVLSAKVQWLLRQRKFDELETIAATYRRDKTRDRDGRRLIHVFYAGTDAQAETPEQWLSDLELLEAWLQAHPKSLGAQLSLAIFWRDYAWNARGNGFANTVTPERFALFQERLAKSTAAITKCEALDQRDAHLYLFQVQLAVPGALSLDALETALNKSLELDPEDLEIVRSAVAYFLPRWHGGAGDTEKFAERAAELTKQRCGDAAYTLAVAGAAGYHGTKVFHDFRFDWDRVKAGFADLRRIAPESQAYAELNVKLAGYHGDRTETHAAFARLDVLLAGKRRVPRYLEDPWRNWSSPDYLAGDQLVAYEPGMRPITAIHRTVDGGRWIALGGSGELLAVDSETGKEISRIRTGSEAPRFSALVPFGKKLVFAASTQTITLFDIASGESRQLGTHAEVSAAGLSTDGGEYATTGSKKIMFWNLDKPDASPETWEPKLRGKRADTKAIAYVPNERTVVVGLDGEIVFMNRDTQEQIGALPPLGAPALGCKVTSDGKLLVVLCQNELSLWRLADKSLVAKMSLAGITVNQINFSPDGRFVAVATGWQLPTSPREVRVWSTADGKLLHTFRGHKGIVRAVFFSPDGTRAISAGDDGTIRTWKVE